MPDTSDEQPSTGLGESRVSRSARSARDPVEQPGDEIGAYTLISKIGEGGFGTVWLAERRQPFVQRVALKLIHLGFNSTQVVARFEQERQALALMSHPNIAQVLDGGVTQSGRPYFVMEYVAGEPITEFCDARKLNVRERLELFAQACDAIQHAHLKGVVHRDIKPWNVLAFEVDGKRSLKVIDFGVAKALTQRMSEHTIFTETGQMIGTPEYMSPEQADPSLSDVDTRSDVYSLGVLLYELVAGALPFDPRDLRSRAYGEIRRVIREVDPPTPSARLSTVATKDAEAKSRIEKARGVAVRDLVRQLKSELEWIPLMAMRKEPQLRYQSAAMLGDDVRNYLDGKPLVAGPESLAYRARKYARRNPLRAAATVGLPLVLAVLLGVVAVPAYRAYAAYQRELALQRYTVLAVEPDPAVVTDADARARIKATGKPWKIRHDETGIVMLLCPPGEYMMGMPETVPGWVQSNALHRCAIRRPFYLAEREVSQAEWMRLMPSNPANYDDDSKLPVESTSWNDSQDFCAASGGFFRLPSEEEWEYACRAGTATQFSFGENITPEQVNYDGDKPFNGAPRGLKRGRTVPCGSLPANPWGFHEMHGNVFEWCQDAASELAGATEEPARPTRAKSNRALRGGSWDLSASVCRSGDRYSRAVRRTDFNVGLRVARTAD